jgi:hypothetical protein
MTHGDISTSRLVNHELEKLPLDLSYFGGILFR